MVQLPVPTLSTPAAPRASGAVIRPLPAAPFRVSWNAPETAPMLRAPASHCSAAAWVKEIGPFPAVFEPSAHRITPASDNGLAAGRAAPPASSRVAPAATLTGALGADAPRVAVRPRISSTP